MKLKIMNSKEKKNIIKLIKAQYGCSFNLDYEVFMNQNNKLFFLSKDVKKIDLEQLRINNLGLYFGEINVGKLRLSIEGSQLIGPIAKKNVLELNDSMADKWLAGEDFDVDSELEGFVIVKNNSDFLGCGKIIKKKLLNYVPKERRV